MGNKEGKRLAGKDRLMRDLREIPIPELLAFEAAIKKELQSRNVLRSANSPVADLAEYLFCRTFGWKQAPASEKGFDAMDDSGRRYQIKGRRITPSPGSRQLSAIRSFDGFDVLAVLLFREDYQLHRAALVPNEVAKRRCRFQERTNSYIFRASDEVWKLSDVRDVTSRLREAWTQLK